MKTIYILNNLTELDEIPVSLKGKPEYEKLFEMAEVGNLTPKEMNEYQHDLKIRRDNYNSMLSAKEEGLEKGLKGGVEKGRVEGRHELAQVIASKLKKEGISIAIIAKITELSLEEVKAV